jgi:hypothetical protein
MNLPLTGYLGCWNLNCKSWLHAKHPTTTTSSLCPQWRQFQDQDGIEDYLQNLYSDCAVITTTSLCPQWRQFQDQDGIEDYLHNFYSNCAVILCNNQSNQALVAYETSGFTKSDCKHIISYVQWQKSFHNLLGESENILELDDPYWLWYSDIL